MIIIGASGHVKDMMADIALESFNEPFFVFDDVSESIPHTILQQFQVIRTLKEAVRVAENDSFVLAIGKPSIRKKLFYDFNNLGFKAANYIASTALVSKYAKLGEGLNVMPFCSIFTDAVIGDGCLINSYASVHHDAQIGNFVSLAPGVRILGKVIIKDAVEIGANAVILPGVTIEKNAIIGAGSVVLSDIPEGATAVGVPAKIIQK